jgi:hypothetical protein
MNPDPGGPKTCGSCGPGSGSGSGFPTLDTRKAQVYICCEHMDNVLLLVKISSLKFYGNNDTRKTQIFAVSMDDKLLLVYNWSLPMKTCNLYLG